jgi:hypothetical protein
MDTRNQRKREVSMKKKTAFRFHGFQTPPIFQWFNTPSHRRRTLTWIRNGNGKGLVPSHMAKAVQEHNDFCDKRDAFIAATLPIACYITFVLILTAVLLRFGFDQ